MSASSFLDGNACVVGLQWGDEGKGKIVDFLSEKAEVIARYCGGANAGHSVVINGVKHSTHLLPVGIFRKHTLNLIGNGVVLDPEKLFEEIQVNTDKGFTITPETLKVSYKTHVVMPWHKLEDAARENAAGASGIGTTKRGIGPTYADKMHRTSAIRVGDLLHEQSLKEKIHRITSDKNKVFAAMYDQKPLDADAIFKQYRDFGIKIAPYVDDTGYLLIQAWKAGKKILFEGAHAALLDVDHGTYPYVTSSSCSTLGLFSGTGAPPQCVKQYIGIMKAYSTRVGGGPFPTEQDNATGNYIRERGNEYGTTTRRPRRCGWFDAVAVKYSVDLCGATTIAVMLLDVLSGLDEIKICTGYKVDGKLLPYFRADVETLAKVEPVYETFPGWHANLSDCKTFDQLPAEAKAYVKRLEELAGVPISMVSVGPDRTATLMR